MRTRTAFTNINGRQQRIFKVHNCIGCCISAVFVTSETASHAESSIRKINSYKHMLLHSKPKVNTSQKRRELFSLLSKAQYRTAIGL